VLLRPVGFADGREVLRVYVGPSYLWLKRWGHRFSLLHFASFILRTHVSSQQFHFRAGSSVNGRSSELATCATFRNWSRNVQFKAGARAAQRYRYTCMWTVHTCCFHSNLYCNSKCDCIVVFRSSYCHCYAAVVVRKFMNYIFIWCVCVCVRVSVELSVYWTPCQCSAVRVVLILCFGIGASCIPDPLYPSGYFTCHQVWHTKILRFAHRMQFCILCGLQNKVGLFLYISLLR
jgi:hypothetical protein